MQFNCSELVHIERFIESPTANYRHLDLYNRNLHATVTVSTGQGCPFTIDNITGSLFDLQAYTSIFISAEINNSKTVHYV